MNRFLVVIVLSILVSCQPSGKKIKKEDYQHDFDKLMFQIVPFIAKLHDSISENKRFDTSNNQFMLTHIVERQYQWLNFYQDDSNQCFFQIKRLEPSIKKDKFSAICGTFKLSSENTIDPSTFKEIYWTWKMRTKELDEKSIVLFNIVLEKKSIKPYCYPQAKEDWIEFPSDKVIYDNQLQKWKTIEF